VNEIARENRRMRDRRAETQCGIFLVIIEKTTERNITRKQQSARYENRNDNVEKTTAKTMVTTKKNKTQKRKKNNDNEKNDEEK
jgi:hypothetical protein